MTSCPNLFLCFKRIYRDQTDPLFILNFYGSYSVLLEVKFAALNVYVSSLKLLLLVISITRASILKVCSLRHLLPIFTLHL